MHPYTPPAVAGTLEVWKRLAARIQPREQASGPSHEPEWWREYVDALYLQVQRWYDLVALGQDPTTLITHDMKPRFRVASLLRRRRGEHNIDTVAFLITVMPEAASKAERAEIRRIALKAVSERSL
jgi:hypothetical protein